MIRYPLEVAPWPFWKKTGFRFFFIYFLLQLAPWTWLEAIPGIEGLFSYYYAAADWVVETANRHIFHVKEVLVPMGGSGDTSYGWAQLWAYLSLAGLGCVVWTLADRKSAGYPKMGYWLRTMVRFSIAMIALGYGILKLFALQMVFPNQSQLATPLGDFLPMRFSWLFIGYSTPYQVFSGVMETLAGLLLLYRPTVKLGLLLGLGVFTNVFMLNLCYDIPVKIYSAHLVLYCAFLLAWDCRRLLDFFILNRLTAPDTAYDLVLDKKWMRVSRWGLKGLFVVLAVVMPFVQSWGRYQAMHKAPAPQPIPTGMYEVRRYVVNRDSLCSWATDSLCWKDLILENGGYGSIHTTDTLFRQRYHRGYFIYATDSIQHTLAFKKTMGDSLPFLTLRYERPDHNTLRLWTKLREDSLYLELAKSNRHFQLAEKQFHWLSEANR